MKKFINKLIILLLGSFIMVVSLNAGAYSEDFFAIKVKTDNTGSSNDTQFTLPIRSDESYNYHIICDDNDMGNTTHLNQTTSTTCTYAVAGTYTIIMTGANDDSTGFPAIYFNNDNDERKILEVVQWGTGKWQSMESAFAGAYYLTVTASDNPDLSEDTNLSNMFHGANSLIFSHSINDWNVSNVTDMSSMFRQARNFNEDISSWNVSNVTNMAFMFFVALSFDQDIGSWDVSNVTDMHYMLSATDIFDQDIGSWDVSNVTDMNSMFSNAHVFNQNIGDWNISKVTNTSYMFSNAYIFDQNISNWDVSNVTDMDGMFADANAFNQDIGSWSVSEVTTMNYMFTGADAFDQDIGDWNVSNVTSMYDMFAGTEDFNQDIGNWNVSQVNAMDSMFEGADKFNQDIGDWNVSKVTTMENMFYDATVFNQDIGDWNVSKVSDIAEMFQYNSLSVSNYDNLLKGWSKLELTDSLDFHAGGSKYCQGEDAKNLIISDHSWTFNDGDKDCNFYITSSNAMAVKSGEKVVGSLSATMNCLFVIRGGTDNDKFIIKEDDGTYSLEFIEIPDNNHPTDSNHNNIYRVRVQAINPGAQVEDYQTIKVTVESNGNATLIPVISYLLF